MFESEIKRFNGLVLKALADARDLKGRYDAAGEWAADEREQWDRANADFATHHAALEQLKKDQAEQAQMQTMAAQYEQPARAQVPGQPAVDMSPEALLAKRKQAHNQALRTYLQMGESGLTAEQYQRYMVGRPSGEEMAGLSPQQQYALSSVIGDLGGFAAQDTFMSELVKDVAGYAVIRPHARVRETPGLAATFLTIASGTDPYPSGLSGSWRAPDWRVAGGVPPVQSQPTFGRERVPLHMWAPDAVVIPMELIQTSSIDLEAEIRMLFAETKGLDEDSGFINGTGVNSPLGLVTDVTNGNIVTVNSGAANNQSYGGILTLYTTLPAQYRGKAMWLMNSLTYGLMLQLETTGGMVLFPPNTLPNRLFERPIEFSEFMPDGDTDGNYPVIFGDFNYYAIGDRSTLRFIRLTETFVPNIGLMVVGHCGGQALKFAPFRAQVVAA